MICNHDCFHCPYEDCINDEMDGSELLVTIENEKIAKRQKRLEQNNIDIARKFPEYKRQEVKKHKPRRSKFASDEERREYYKQYMREYQKKNKERISEYKKLWYRANLEKVRERHKIYAREYRKTKLLEENI